MRLATVARSLLIRPIADFRMSLRQCAVSTPRVCRATVGERRHRWPAGHFGVNSVKRRAGVHQCGPVPA
jgi:hypothetical protein